MQIMSIRTFCVTATLVLGVAVAAAQDVPGQEGGNGETSGNATNTSSAPEVELDTTEGKILIELNPEKAPKTVTNFLDYVESGHYDGTVFHRVIDGFMIQGGGMDGNLKEKKTKPPVLNEADNGLINKKYTVAMARTGDPHSATCQFFINTADNTFLDRANAADGFGYTVFGRVVKGLDVVDKIGSTPTNARPNPAFPAMLMRDVPVTPIVIKSARVVSKKEN
jgi:cyclophilin family peptidyl-prolyl cis-trans isomerase